MHGFVDMNVFYTEHELRKQADTFTGKVRKGTHNVLVSVFPALNFGLVLFSCCIFEISSPQAVMTGQETPNTDKPLGDPVAARLPYAILTKMVTFHGWKRFEKKSTMKFHGITEATFPSIMRRSLVILCKGRFVSAARLARLPVGTQGYFLMQEDMKDFVTSRPAAGALFRMLMGDPRISVWEASARK